MDEATWLACDDARRLLAAVRSRCSERKLRLAACACCRAVWVLVTDRRSRRAVEAAERHADSLADDGLLLDRYPAAVSAAHKIERKFGEDDPRLAVATAASYTALTDPAEDVARFTINQLLPALPADGHARLCATLREVLGNPFRPVAVPPESVSPAAQAVARTVYDEGQFAELPVLADALEDDGCSCRELLEHLRSAGPHFRGCWALDAVLGNR